MSQLECPTSPAPTDRRKLSLICAGLLIVLCAPGDLLAERLVLPLHGAWSFALGAAPSTNADLPRIEFSDIIQLPGTTDTNRKGPQNTERWAGGLTRPYKVVGPAWYQREVMIPENWRAKRVCLFLERTKYTRLWLDGRAVGENRILCTPQEYALGSLEPGPHRLTLLIDNARKPVNAETHQMSENTQGNWNGVIGRVELRATNPVWLEEVQVYPDLNKGSVRVRAQIGNTTGVNGQGKLELQVKTERASRRGKTAVVTWSTEGGTAEEEIQLGGKMQLWDEFHPTVYTLVARLVSGSRSDEFVTSFGAREFTARGTQFAINGRATFLRGKHDGCVFPLTGHPPMDVAGWLNYFRVCREYGLNHIRFHTWTPPEAAFEAADQLGLYLQPELPFWGNYDEAVKDTLMPEAERILKVYGNHPSFVMFALGNECFGSRAIMGSMVSRLRSQDSRRLYAQGSNNYFTEPKPADTDDYWTTFRTGMGRKHNVRGSFATVDGGNGHVQIGPPGTTNTYSAAIADISLPVIGHEVGQYTVYPNFREIAKYTGVFRPRNFEIFRDKLARAGLLEQADDFFRASGKLVAICYREEVEAALRTPGFGGFQLLDLQDFPGQGTALVGLLDAFMDSKGAIASEQWRQFCGPVVPMALIDRYVWTPSDFCLARIQVANYGEKELRSAVLEWALKDETGIIHEAGKLPGERILQGKLQTIGTITVPLTSIVPPARVTLELKLRGSDYSNSYHLWVFPPQVETPVPSGVTLARSFNSATWDALAQGGRLVLIPEADRLASTVGGGFATDFWCWPMFHNTPGTMGLLCDPSHPALAGFPTSFHSDWQWFHLLTNSQPVILEEEAAGIRPIAQIIDNLDRVHKLGLIFEAKVGRGRLLVCATDLLAMSDRPEARQLLRSLLDYAASDKFEPSSECSIAEIKSLLSTSLHIRSAMASSAQSENFAAAMALDRKLETRWCAAELSTNEWLEVDLGRLHKVSGCAIRWEFDRPGYAYNLQGSEGGAQWTLLSDQSRNTEQGRHRLDFPPVTIRFIRVHVSGLPPGCWPSIRELEVLGED